MNRNTFFILLAAIACSVAGQFLLKAAANQLGAVRAANLVTKLGEMATQPLLWLGFCIYGISAIGYVVVLSRARLSVAAPMVAISYVFTVLGGHFLFKEMVSPGHWLGVLLIILGVSLILRA